MFASGKTAAVASAANYIEEVFSTYLYTGTGASQTITNGIDLSTKGGMVWLKARNDGTFYHQLIDTSRGALNRIASNSTDAQTNDGVINSFTSSGFVLNTNYLNSSGQNNVSWTFRKQAKFFDVVTYTGNGANPRTITHSLGSAPGCIIFKNTSSADDWYVYHRSLATSKELKLNTTDAQITNTTGKPWNTTPTSTEFYVGGSFGQNITGETYVAYLFAHDAGGFGLTGTDNVISCGSFTKSSGVVASITLGYEPQWLLFKRTDTAENWFMIDNMRGMTMSTDAYLIPNLSNAEANLDFVTPTATGFEATNNFNNGTYIYIAIRRGPMKVPTSGTSVFYPNAVAQADSPDSSNVPFPPDLVNTFSRDGVDRFQSNQFNFVDRLRGLGTPNNTYTASGPALTSSSTIAESSTFPYVQLKADSQNITRGSGWNSASYGNWIYYFMRRAPSFFDEVCYTATVTDPTTMTLNHNLGVVPQMMIKKARQTTSVSNAWRVYHIGLNGGVNPQNAAIILNSSGAETVVTPDWGDTAPTSTQFTVGYVESGYTYVTYLFATCAGVSKVGSYTGTGTTKQVDCGFTGGARFVLIKRTDSTGDWYVWDTARGIVSGNDPYLLLNSTAAEVTNTDYVDTYSAGFEISSTAPAAINASGGTFIFLAIA